MKFQRLTCICSTPSINFCLPYNLLVFVTLNKTFASMGTIPIFLYQGLTPEELSRLAAAGNRGWLATDYVTWILNQLNSMQRDAMLLCPNAVVNIPNEMARKRKQFNFGMVKRLVLPRNVGKPANGDTFIGGINDSGNHWALVMFMFRIYQGKN